MRRLLLILAVCLPLVDLVWNLTHLNIGLQDFFGLAAFAHGLVENGAWPATPYFPAGYPLLLIPGGLMGNVLIWGYILSAAGCILGLTGLARLLDVFEVDAKYQAMAVAAAWLMPVWRIPAGSPSVDMLYTGLGIWFIGGAIHIWRLQPERWHPAGIPRWIYWSLLASPALLTFLRYHSLVLIVPILLVLLIKHRGRLRILHYAVLAVALVTTVNHLVPLALTGKPVPSVVSIQIRSGIEFDHHIDYLWPEDIFENYGEFAESTRDLNVVEHYGLPLVVNHTLKGWLKFVRRPAIAFALTLFIVAFVFRRRIPEGIGILALWIPLYCLALSPAYYTPRAATLPALVSLAILFVIALQINKLQYRAFSISLVVVLLVVGFSFASKFSDSLTSMRWLYGARSRVVTDTLQPTFNDSSGPDFKSILTYDDRIFNISSQNPWCVPYVSAGGSWVLDPAISREQYPGLEFLSHNIYDLSINDPDFKRINIFITYIGDILDPFTEYVMDSPEWSELPIEGLHRTYHGLAVYKRNEPLSPDDGG